MKLWLSPAAYYQQHICHMVCCAKTEYTLSLGEQTAFLLIIAKQWLFWECHDSGQCQNVTRSVCAGDTPSAIGHGSSNKQTKAKTTQEEVDVLATPGTRVYRQDQPRHIKHHVPYCWTCVTKEYNSNDNAPAITTPQPQHTTPLINKYPTPLST